MSARIANDLNVHVELNLDVLFPIAMAIISTVMVAYPVWNPVVILTAFVISAIVSCGIFYGMIYIFIPKEGMSNNVVGLFLYSMICFYAILLFTEGVIFSKLHGW